MEIESPTSALNHDMDESTRSRKDVISKTAKLCDELLQRFTGICLKSGTNNLAEEIGLLADYIKQTFGIISDNIDRKDVEMGVMLSLIYDIPLGNYYTSFIASMGAEELRNSFSQATLSLFRIMGWIS